MTATGIAVIGWVSLLLAWWAYCWPYRRYQVDKTRYELFVVRDQLFDAAVQGDLIKFDDPAYGMTRTTLNGMLRMLEDFSFIQLLALVWRLRDKRWRHMCALYSADVKRALDELSPDGRKLVNDTMAEAGRIFLSYLTKTSLAIRFFFVMCKVLVHVWTFSSQVKKYSGQFRRAMDYESNVAGRDNWKATDVRATT